MKVMHVVGARPNLMKTALRQSCDWTPPPEYLESHVASTVAKMVLGHHLKRGGKNHIEPAERWGSMEDGEGT